MLKWMLDRPITVTMALVVVLVLGITGIRMLPVSLIPDIDIPYMTVQVSAPNLSAREIDETVCRPLRQQLVQINSLEDIRSESRDGSGMIRLTFAQGADMDYLFIEVNEKGSEAAAVTSVSVMRTTALPPDYAVFTVDRPFVFLIRERATGTVLFLGMVRNL